MEIRKLRSQLAESERVLKVAAAAVKVLVQQKLGHNLSTEEAESLALSGDLGKAVRDFQQRLRVPRPALDREGRVKLAARQVALEPSDADASEVRNLVQETIKKAEAETKADRVERQSFDEMRQLLVNYETDSPKLRMFMRRSERLWKRQVHRLESAISQREIRDLALDEVREIYTRHFEAAIELLEASGIG